MSAPITRKNAHLWARHPDDWYVEPRWCSERLFAAERFTGMVWDPACGMGRIVESADAAGLIAFGSDKVHRGAHGALVLDFLTEDMPWKSGPANIVSNPPFGIAEEFVSRALTLATRKVAMLLPTKWIHGDRRSRWLQDTPLAKVLFITPRPSMPPGPVIEAGIEAGGGTADFAWFVWDHAHEGVPVLGWLRRDGA